MSRPSVTKGGFESGRAFLFKGQPEDPAFGLYTYVIIPRRPGNKYQEARLESLAVAYFNLDPMDKLREEFKDPKMLNCFYWPLDLGKGAPPGRPARNLWAVKHYNYPKGLRWARLAGQNCSEGPYLVASRTPFGQRTAGVAQEELFIMDLTRVHRDYFYQALCWYRDEVANDPANWRQGFALEKLQIHVKSALKNAPVVLSAMLWVKDNFMPSTAEAADKP